jgi:hypothetical protein
LLTREVPRPEFFKVPPVMLPTTSSSNNSLCFTLFVQGSSFANDRSVRWLLPREASDALALWTGFTVVWLSANKIINQIPDGWAMWYIKLVLPQSQKGCNPRFWEVKYF